MANKTPDGVVRGLSPTQALERLARAGATLKEQRGDRRVYVHSGGRKSVRWLGMPDGTVTLEEYNGACNC